MIAAMERTVLITGGTGGLGRAVVGAFVANGWRVVVLDARAGRAGGRARSCEADLTDPAAVRARSSAPRRRAAPLRAVVNLVGGFAADQPVATTPVEEFEAQFRLNLRPTYLVTQAALPRARRGRRRRDRLRLLALGAAPVRRRGRLLRVEGGGDRVRRRSSRASTPRDGVRCNAVLPSMIDTPANRAAMPPEQHGEAHAAGRDRGRDPVPLQRRVGADDRRRDPGLRRAVLSRRRSGSPGRRARACGARCRPR